MKINYNKQNPPIWKKKHYFYKKNDKNAIQISKPQIYYIWYMICDIFYIIYHIMIFYILYSIYSILSLYVFFFEINIINYIFDTLFIIYYLLYH